MEHGCCLAPGRDTDKGAATTAPRSVHSAALCGSSWFGHWACSVPSHKLGGGLRLRTGQHRATEVDLMVDAPNTVREDGARPVTNLGLRQTQQRLVALPPMQAASGRRRATVSS